MSKTRKAHKMSNDLIDLTNERVDNLAALVTVSVEQLKARQLAESALESGAGRTDELVSLVFGSSVPSVENYLAACSSEPVAA